MSTIQEQVREAETPVGRDSPALRMTEAEFVDWCQSDTWAEWVDGDVIMMSPVSAEHDSLSTFLIRLLGEFVESRDLGTLHAEPFQVRLPGQRRRRSPDLFFVAAERRDIVKKHHVEGPPDLIVEIVSPESQARDWREKYLEYEAAGIREYWVIDPMSQHMEAYAAVPERQYQRIEEKDGRIASVALPGFFLRPEWLWQENKPKVAIVLAELAQTR